MSKLLSIWASTAVLFCTFIAVVSLSVCAFIAVNPPKMIAALKIIFFIILSFVYYYTFTSLFVAFSIEKVMPEKRRFGFIAYSPDTQETAMHFEKSIKYERCIDREEVCKYYTVFV